MLTSTAEYALRAIVAIAQANGRAQTSANLANITKVPHGYLLKVLQALARSGLLVSQRGLGGGFILGRRDDEISVLDVLRAVDAAPQRIETCPLGIEGHQHLCPVHQLLDEAMERNEQAYCKALLSDLKGSVNNVQALCS